MTRPVEITLTLDLDAHLSKHIGYDEDGEPIQQAIELEDVLIGLVANKLVDRLVSQRGNWDGAVRERVNQVRDEVIVERITPLIDDALAAAVQPTNRFGEPSGEPTTLRSVIVQEATAWLTKPTGDSFTRSAKTNVAKLIADEVDRALGRELKTALDQAKADVTAAVKAKGAEVLAQTITEMARGRS